MAIARKKQLRPMSKQELTAKLAEVEAELKRVFLTRDKNTAKRRELRKLKSRLLNYLNARDGKASV